MSVQFEEDNFTRNQYAGYAGAAGQPAAGGSKMANWLVKMGLATNAQAANTILLVIMVCIFGLSIYFFIFGFSLPTFSGGAPVEEEVIEP